jgi:hypothetical protein
VDRKKLRTWAIIITVLVITIACYIPSIVYDIPVD